MNIIDIILYIIAITNLVLSAIILFRNPRDKINIYYALTVLSVALWTFGIVSFRSSVPSSALFWVIFYYLSASFVATYFLYFTIVFVGRAPRGFSILKHILMHAPVIVIFFLLVFNWGFIKNFSFQQDNKYIELGTAYYFYIIHFVVYMGTSFILLAKKLFVADGIEKKQLKFILSGTLIATIFGAMFNLFLPLFNYQLIWLGPYFTLIMVITIAYAIVKHHLMNIKIITTEIFVGGIVFVLLINFLTSQAGVEWIVRGFLLIACSGFGYLIIRSVLREVKIREEIEEIAKKLSVANEKLKQLDRAKTEFISIASHQLRSPLTAIKGYSSMILEDSFGKIDGKLKDVAERIFQSSNRLVSIIGDFLDVSRIELGKMEYDFTDFDIKEMISGLVDEFGASNRNSNIALSFESKDADKLIIRADYNKIRQVISNIIDNAMKYTHKGFVRVFLSTGHAPNTVLVAIKDSGRGMDKDALEHIFQKFSRAKDAAKSRTDGSGLGLYVASEMVKAHKGKIWAQSEGIEKGSTFYVELPIK